MNEKLYRFSLLVLLNIGWNNNLTDNELLEFGVKSEQLKYKGMESIWSEILRPLAINYITNCQKNCEDKIKKLEDDNKLLTAKVLI